MPIYDRPIDSSSFQPLTTASSMENYGVGNMVLDMGLAIGGESLGAGLLGMKGITGGRPLMGLIPGVSPTPGGQMEIEKALKRSLTRDFMKAGVRDRLIRTATPTASPLVQGGLVEFHKQKSLDQMLDFMAKNKGAIGKESTALSMKLGIGTGLRAFSQAWIINDLFSMGFSAASSAIQGIESFSYERRARLQGEGGLSADLGEGFADTRASFTQRQRTMQAIHNSQMNTRAAMGNEATFMHV